MSGFTVEYFADLQDSPAVALIDAYKSEIIEKGFSQGANSVYITPNAWTVAAMDGNKCIGFMLHVPYSAVDALWIEAAYVAPEYRRKGIHKAMFKRVVRQAEIEGVSSVQGAAHVNNIASISSMERQGRHVTGIIYSYDVKKEE